MPTWKPSVYTNKKKFGKREFVSSYVTTKGDRYFVLTSGQRKVQFDSPQAAVKAGWIKK